jgi:hypothetical protein
LPILFVMDLEKKYQDVQVKKTFKYHLSNQNRNIKI